MPEAPIPVQLPMQWLEDVGRPPAAQLANLFNVQMSSEGVVLVVGQALLPLMKGDSGDVMRQSAELRAIYAEPLATYFIPHDKVEALLGVLKAAVDARANALAARDSGQGGDDA